MPLDFNLAGKILITGHTGFKGTWLTLLAEELGMEVVGISLPPDKDSLYTRLARNSAIEEYFLDINNYEELYSKIQQIKPHYVFHLAAQALVEDSYLDPIRTFQTNVIGTANLLNVVLKTDTTLAVGVVTTDKVYRNDNLGIPFVESDPLGGKDPYSASKVGTENVVNSWKQISELQSGPKLISLRAGNVIGGGDFAQNRIIPDLIRSKVSGTPAVIRNPESTRPWQHVLDPLIGYLRSLVEITSGSLDVPALNFGPLGESLAVRELVRIATDMDSSIPAPTFLKDQEHNRESIHLSLDSHLAAETLSWTNQWSQVEAIQSSVLWWKNTLSGKMSPYEACKQDLRIALKS
jgi:CDP-glucose 4,6-dehydratase